jgi:carbamoyl-phosphate synthase large subunit
MNILILSCGTRNKIVQYFVRELKDKGLVMAADCNNLAPALYEANKHFIVPRMDDRSYFEVILNICKENKIDGVLSLIDPELSLLAEHKDDFLSIGTTPIVSDYKVVEMCFDKYEMHKFLIDKSFKAAKSYINKEKFYSEIEAGVISYPVFIKPVRGSASININKVSSKEEVEMLFKLHDNLMIQEFIDGIEYGIDCYIDMISSEPVAIFAKEKIKMRAGETDKSVSVKDENLFGLIKSFVKAAELKGIIDIDIFKVNGDYYISEVNPRFGGGYPHAYESGVNIPKMIIKNIDGYINSDIIGQYDQDIYMMKYNEVKIIKK